MSTALIKLAENTGVSTEEISEVVRGMIISGKNQHGAVATNAEMTVVAGICGKYGLNPMIREAHAFISGGKLQVIIGIDGWIKIMNRQPDFDGFEQIDHFNDKGDLVSVETKIYIKGRRFPTPHTEYMSECYQPKSPAWQKFKCRMLTNKSLGQTIRIAFGISEVIDDDEQNRIIDNSPKISKPVQAVDFEEMEHSMAECGDIDSLNELCVKIRSELEKGNAWESSKAKCAAMKIQHKNRIETMVDDIEDDEFFDIDTEEEPDIDFEDKVEFE